MNHMVWYTLHFFCDQGGMEQFYGTALEDAVAQMLDGSSFSDQQFLRTSTKRQNKHLEHRN